MADQVATRVAAVLDEVIAEFGRRVASDPRQLRGLLSDSLGAGATECHDHIEAVVAAAAAGLPQAILATGGEVDRAELLSMMPPQVGEPAQAERLLDVWLHALKVQDRQPTDPAPTATAEMTAVPADLASTSGTLAAPPPGEATEQLDATGTEAAARRYRSRRKSLLLVTGARLAFGLVAVAFFLAARANGEDLGYLLWAAGAGIAVQFTGLVGVLKQRTWGLWVLLIWAGTDVVLSLIDLDALLSGGASAGLGLSLAQLLLAGLLLRDVRDASTAAPPAPSDNGEPATDPSHDQSADGSSPRRGDRARVLLTSRRTLVVTGSALGLLLIGSVAYSAMRNGPSADLAVDDLPAGEDVDVDDTPDGADEVSVLEMLVAFPEETTDWGATVQRTWVLTATDVLATVELTASEDGAAGSLFEVFPASLAIDGDAIRFEDEASAPDHYVNEFAARFVIDLEPDATQTLVYTLPTATIDAADEQPDVDSLLAEWQAAMDDFLAAPEPELSVEEPADGDTFDVAELTIAGTSTESASIRITVGTEKTTINAATDGAWKHDLILAEGTNEIKVRATDVVTTKRTTTALTVTYEPPSDGSDRDDGDGGSDSAPKDPAPKDPEPVNRAPVAKCSSPTVNGAGWWEFYRVHILTSCFEDPDGDPFTITAGNPNWGRIGPAQSSDCKSGQTCWRYYPDSAWDGTPGCPSFPIWAVDSKGASSSSLTFTVCLNY